MPARSVPLFSYSRSPRRPRLSASALVAVVAVVAVVAMVAVSSVAYGADTTPPVTSRIVPEIGATVRPVQWVSVSFSEPVAGVDAGDLLLDGKPAVALNGSDQGPYIFQFGPSSERIARVSWAEDHGIRDLADPANPFEGTGWAYRVDATLPASRLEITELLADNPGGLEDADGDSPDWIEIHNDGDDWVNLDGWALTDDAATLDLWVFPPRLLEPRGYVVVFASGKDWVSESNDEWHTSFKLALPGEFLALSSPPDPSSGASRQVVSVFAPTYGPQKSGVSFGLDVDGQARYFRTPTPGEPNSEGYVGFVADTKFSVDRGFHQEPFAVEIATETSDARIVYTTDGSEPGELDGIPYEGPLVISGTTTLRAAAYVDGLIPTNVDTQTYLFLDDVVSQDGAGFPSSWGGVPADYRVDPDVTGSPLYRDTFRDDLLSISTVSLVMSVDDLFGPLGIYTNPERTGSAWERATSMEVIHPDGSPGFQIDAGAQIFGNASRVPTNTGKHSIRVLFKGIYGATKLRHRVFETSDVDEFDTLMLRGGYNYKWTHSSSTQQQRAQYARDEFARLTQKDLGQPASHGIYVHLYLNGLYWGMFNLVERPDESFASSHLGGDKDDYDVIKAGEPPLAISGDKIFWSEMMDLANAGVASSSRYEQILEYLDVDNLIDYTILNHYIGNVDGPVCICGTNRPRNFYAARLREPGGKYRFFAWDSEHSLSETNVDRTELGVSDADDTPARLYARLRANAEFRVLFGDHVHRHFYNGGALAPQSCIDRYMDNAARIDRAIVGESARWGDYRRSQPYTRDAEWLTEQRRLVNSFFPARSNVVLSQYRADGLYPRVSAPTFRQHGGEIPAEFRLRVQLSQGEVYFTTDGTDPRLPGGAVAPTAELYEPLYGDGSPDDPGIPLPDLRGVTVKARTLEDGDWSALNEATFVRDLPADLRITEIMYHALPPDPPSAFGDNDFEYIEIQNVGQAPVDLTGIRLTDGVAFEFPAGESLLGAGEYAVVVESLEAFRTRYPSSSIRIAGEYSGDLDNAGERVVLEDALGRVILDFTYDDAWYPETDGSGRSLQIRDALAPVDSWSESGTWRASQGALGSPGEADSEPPLGGGQLPGDVNQDARTDLSDAVRLLGYLFLAGPETLPCEGESLTDGGNLEVFDLNGDGGIDITDPIVLLSHLFVGGPPPALGTSCVRVAGCTEICSP